MYYQTEWDDSTEKTLVFSSKGSFILPLSARPNTLLPNLYAYMFVHTHVILPCRIFGPCLSVRVPLSPDRGLPLYPNRVLHVRLQISTERPPPVIVRLICSQPFLESCSSVSFMGSGYLSNKSCRSGNIQRVTSRQFFTMSRPSKNVRWIAVTPLSAVPSASNIPKDKTTFSYPSLV